MKKIGASLKTSFVKALYKKQNLVQTLDYVGNFLYEMDLNLVYNFFFNLVYNAEILRCYILELF